MEKQGLRSDRSSKSALLSSVGETISSVSRCFRLSTGKQTLSDSRTVLFFALELRLKDAHSTTKSERIGPGRVTLDFLFRVQGHER